ncbi:hypothetical protein INR49_002026, partial [Caranx melampygus]
HLWCQDGVDLSDDDWVDILGHTQTLNTTPQNNDGMAPLDQNPRLPVQTAEEAVTVIHQAATRLKNLEKDPIETNAKHATAEEVTEQTATGHKVSQYKPAEDVKTEQEEVQCSLLPDLDYIDGNNPTQFNIFC